MTAARDNEPPLTGRWQTAHPFVWGGHVSPQFVLLMLILHGVGFGWFMSDWNHIRMLLYSFHEVASERDVNAPPEALDAQYDYLEDPPDRLRHFRVIAEPLVAGIPSAPDRARALADYIYSLRTTEDIWIDEDLRFGPDFLFDRMREGRAANCGQMSTILATLWRSMGGHSRAVRWATHTGVIGHYAIELWDPERARWFYYDMNLNGYAHDDDGETALSVAGLRSNLLTGEDLHFTANPTRHDYTLDDLMATVRQFSAETYVLNNDYLHWVEDRRFGLLNRFYPALAALPHPYDRIVDNLTGGRDRRMVVQGRLLVAGLFSFQGARFFVGYLVFVIVACAVTLRRTWSRPRANRIPPTAGDRPPSR